MFTMTGDEYPEQRLELSNSAYRLDHVGLTSCNRWRTDGRLPKRRMQMLPLPARCRSKHVIQELLDGGFWTDGGDHYLIVGFLDHQRSAEEADAQRTYDAVRQRIRFEKDPDAMEALRDENGRALKSLNQAKQRRRAAAAAQHERVAESRRESQGASPPSSQADSHRESRRPSPSHPAPPRPSEGEGGTAPKNRALTPDGSSRDAAQALKNKPDASSEVRDGASAWLDLGERFAADRANGAAARR